MTYSLPTAVHVHTHVRQTTVKRLNGPFNEVSSGLGYHERSYTIHTRMSMISTYSYIKYQLQPLHPKHNQRASNYNWRNLLILQFRHTILIKVPKTSP